MMLGSQAFIAHVGQLLHKNPVQIVRDSDQVTRIRVCGALDYVMDRSQNQVWAEPSPPTPRERNAAEQPPWYHPLNGKNNDFDVLNPLCRPMWLNYIAARPGWFGYTFSRQKGTQKQLFIENDEMAHALRVVIRTAWRHYCRNAAFIALRHQVATALTQHIGPATIDLAMRARLCNGPAVLHAQHLNLVLRHQRAFATMAHENPQLLTGLTAWLLKEKGAGNEPIGLTDALPVMRHELLRTGLPPMAWRYLVQHGFKRLQPMQPHVAACTPWVAMVRTLQALHEARLPALPPHGFLRLLIDVAGYPDTFEHSRDGLPGWFWQWICNAAHDCKGDTAEYRYLLDQVPAWAWMVRHYQLKPDKNQRRKGIEWLELMTDAMQSLVAKPDVPQWALWLPANGWDESYKQKIVPLQSREALLREAIALHNCADAYQDRCRAETHVLISLRLWAGDRHVALACMERRGNNWVVSQVAATCNQPARPWMRQLAKQACDWVRYHHSQRPTAEQNPPPDADNHEFDELFDERLTVD